MIPEQSDEVREQILALPITYDTEIPVDTVKEYLLALLHWLWSDDNDVKRVYGTSDWRYPLYEALITGNIIQGKIDADGYVDTMSTEEQVKADELIHQAIEKLGW